MNSLKPYLKTVASFLAGAITTYISSQDGGVTSTEWLYVILAGLGSAGLVFAVPNKDPKALHQDESVQPPQRGAGALDLLIAVVVIVFLVWLVLTLAHR